MSYCLLKNGVPIIHEEYERHIRQKEPGDGLTMQLTFGWNRLKKLNDVDGKWNWMEK